MTPSPRTMYPSTGNPDHTITRRRRPISAAPNPTSTPLPFTTAPHIARRGRNHHCFIRWWRRRLLHIHRLRRSYGSRGGVTRVDHVLDDALTDTGVTELDDFCRAEAISSEGALNLADDDVVANIRSRERPHIRRGHRLALLNALIGHRRLRLQPSACIVIHRVPNGT